MMDKYVCSVCGYVYDPAAGDPDNGVKPGLHLRSCQRIGYALFAELRKTSSRKKARLIDGKRY